MNSSYKQLDIMGPACTFDEGIADGLIVNVYDDIPSSQQICEHNQSSSDSEEFERYDLRVTLLERRHHMSRCLSGARMCLTVYKTQCTHACGM